MGDPEATTANVTYRDQWSELEIFTELTTQTNNLSQCFLA